MSDEQPISVRIMDMEYRVACPPDEEQSLLAAAQHLNTTLQDIRETGKVLGTERIAVMAALNISYELLTAQRRLGELDRDTRARTRALLEQVEEALNRFESEPEQE